MVLMAALLPRLGLAHTQGLSTVDFVLGADGRVAARWVFASDEPLGDITPGCKGRCTNADLVAARQDLRAFVVESSTVMADGARCDAHFQDAALSDDGLVLTAAFACRAPTEAISAIEVTLYFLTAMPAGHREVARIVADGVSAEAVLSADHRALTVRLPPSPARSRARARAPWTAPSTLAAATAIGVLIGAATWRGTRRRGREAAQAKSAPSRSRAPERKAGS